MTKKKIMKNVLSLTLALVLTLGAIPFAGMGDLSLPSFGSLTASAAEEIEWTNATKDMLVLSDDGTTITGYTDKLSGNIEIPDKINGTAIIKIESKAFEGCEALTAIKIPQKITSIGSRAFQKCANLETVYFNANNCVINGTNETYAVFSYNDNLTKFIFGEGVKTIPANVCQYARNLQTVEFKDYVTSIGSDAFLNCSSLTDVNLLNVKAIGNNAFKNCISIEMFTFSENLETIGEAAFYGCSIDKITVPTKVTLIGSKAFQKCANLETVYFNANNCVINGTNETYAVFSYNDNLTKFIFGEDVKTIPANVCQYARNLQTVEFKDYVTSIGSDAFSNCSSLTGINLSNVKTIGNNAFKNCISIEMFTFSENLETIGEAAFYGCSMDKITVPAKVTSIGSRAFQKCANLETVYFNANNCVINGTNETYAVFSYNDNLTKFIFGEGVKTIPTNICQYARNLQAVEFNGIIEKVSDNAFFNCSSLETVNYAGTEKDKAKIVFGKNNDYLINATWTCKEEEKPVEPDIPDEPDIPAEPEKPEIPELIDAENITLNYKGSISIAKKEFKNYDITYESSNPEIISVDESGTITAVGSGTATITATVTVDGEVVEDEVTITSSYVWWQWIIVILLFGWLWY